jgi:hypothetical protein
MTDIPSTGARVILVVVTRRGNDRRIGLQLVDALVERSLLGVLTDDDIPPCAVAHGLVHDAVAAGHGDPGRDRRRDPRHR